MAKSWTLNEWDYAAGVDPTLKVRAGHHRWLVQKRICAVPYSREILFKSMARGVPVIFSNLHVQFRPASLDDHPARIAESFAKNLGRATKVRVRVGLSQQSRILSAPELIQRWSGGRAVVNITDLHIRNTPLTRLIDVTPLSDFNLLSRSRCEAIQALEKLTLVITSARGYTDSHTDDLDGSNHCFVGRKLWLVWDVLKGLARGLQDVERCDVYNQATFDIDAFLSLRSSRWFSLSQGETLFLPGSYAHKVITLEHYLGVGSFFVMLPHYLRTLIRWKRVAPLWSRDEGCYDQASLDEVTLMVSRRLRVLKNAPARVQQFWGVEHLVRAVRDWDATCSPLAKRLLNNCPYSAEFLQAARQ